MDSHTALFTRAEQAMTTGKEVVDLLYGSKNIADDQRKALSQRVSMAVERIALSGRLAAESYSRGESDEFERALSIMREHLTLADSFFLQITTRLTGGALNA